MNLLKNQKTAVILMVIMIIVSVILGSSISLRRLTRDTQSVFFDGVQEDGYSVASDISKNADIGSNLLTIAGRNQPNGSDQLADTLKEQVEKVRTAETPSDLYQENTVLSDLIAEMYDLLITSGSLPDDDNNYCIKLYTEMETNNKRIARDPYHEEAAETNRRLNSFPANMLRRISGVKTAAEFK